MKKIIDKYIAGKFAVLMTGAAIAFLLMWSCDKVKDWSNPTDSVAPGKVTNVRVKNISGGAWIYYSLPADDDLLGVKALVTFGEQPREVFSSGFNDSILIEGAPKAGEYTINLYAVDASGNMSEPELVPIQPLTPPVDRVRESLTVNSTFGGVYLLWDNEAAAEVAITVYIQNEQGEWEWYDAYHSAETVGRCVFRGMASVEQSIRVEIRDKWMNYAKDMQALVEPLFEQEIPGRTPDTGQGIWTLYGVEDRTCLYRGDKQDISMNLTSGNNFPKLYDGNYTNWWMGEETRFNNYIADADPDNAMLYPFYFIIDMGRSASYSRFKYWMRPRSPLMSAATPDVFELWGSNHVKAPSEVGDGSQIANLKYWTSWPQVNGTDEWKNDWVKIADCVVRLPSGANGIDGDYTLTTAEDQAAFNAGFDFEIDLEYTTQPFRYIRWVSHKCTTTQSMTQIAELKFFGQYTNE
jgi:hypothetical protein